MGSLLQRSHRGRCVEKCKFKLLEAPFALLPPCLTACYLYRASGPLAGIRRATLVGTPPSYPQCAIMRFIVQIASAVMTLACGAGVTTYVAKQFSPVSAQVDCLGSDGEDINREGRWTSSAMLQNMG